MEKTAAPQIQGRKLLNTFLNPFERENIYSPPGSGGFSRALHHGGALAMGYGGLFLVARKLALYMQRESDENEVSAKLQNYVRARYPSLSPDPSLRDAEKETKLQLRGLPEGARVEDPPLIEEKEAVSQAANAGRPISRQIVREMTGGHDRSHMAVAALAALAGGIGGWRLADYMEEQKRKEEIRKKVMDTQNKIDALLYSELQRTRGQDKTAATGAYGPSDFSSLYPPAASGSTGVGEVAKASLNPANVMRGLESVWWLWAVLAFALSYRASKMYTDKNDTNRMRIKQLEEVAKERSKVREAPVIFEEPLPGEDMGAVPSKPAKPTVSATLAPSSPAAFRPRPVEAPPPTPPSAEALTTTPVDKKDPYASILGQI